MWCIFKICLLGTIWKKFKSQNQWLFKELRTKSLIIWKVRYFFFSNPGKYSGFNLWYIGGTVALQEKFTLKVLTNLPILFDQFPSGQKVRSRFFIFLEELGYTKIIENIKLLRAQLSGQSASPTFSYVNANQLAFLHQSAFWNVNFEHSRKFIFCLWIVRIATWKFDLS